MKELYSTLDCARMLGLEEHRISYAHRTGRLNEPTYFVAGKRIYSEDDVRRVADYFKVPWPLDNQERSEEIDEGIE